MGNSYLTVQLCLKKTKLKNLQDCLNITGKCVWELNYAGQLPSRLELNIPALGSIGPKEFTMYSPTWLSKKVLFPTLKDV